MVGPMVVSAGADVISMGAVISIGEDLASISEDVASFGVGAIPPIGHIMHKHRQA
jgi:hypothetical protein